MLLEDEFGAGGAAEITQLREVIVREPDHAVVHYALGARLLVEDNEQGVALIERAIALNEAITAPGHEALRDYHCRRGEREAAYAHADAASERERIEQFAHAERSVIRVDDKHLPDGLDEATIAPLRARGVVKARPMRKRCKHLPEQPMYVLAFRARKKFWFHNKDRALRIQKRIAEEVAFPGAHVRDLHGRGAVWFARKFRWVLGSRVM